MAYYNRLRDQLRNETPLPEDLSWESMQAGIYDKMGHKKKKRRLLIWWLLPVLICGGICMFLYFGVSKNFALPEEKTNQKNVIASSNIAPTINGQKENINNNSTTEIPVFEPKKTLSKTISSVNQPNVNKVSKKSPNTITDVTNTSTPIANPSSTIEQKSILKYEQINIPSTPTDIVSIDNNLANQRYSDATNPLASPAYLMIEPLTLSIDGALNTLSTRTVTMPEVSPTLPAKNSKNVHFGSMDVMVNAGISFWNIGKPATIQFKSNQHKAIVSEKELPGFCLAIRHDISINKSFFVTTMIDYHQLYSIFTYDGAKNVPKQLDDIIISIHDDLISGEKTFVRGTASVNESVNRKLQHRNETIRSSFSILPGLQHSARNWTFKVNAGPTIGLFTSGKGKTLWNDEVVTYDGDLPQYNNNVKIGFTSSALVKYYISQRWFLHSTVLYQKYLTNHSADPTQIVKPSLWNISAGVGYSF